MNSSSIFHKISVKPKPLETFEGIGPDYQNIKQLNSSATFTVKRGFGRKIETLFKRLFIMGYKNRSAQKEENRKKLSSRRAKMIKDISQGEYAEEKIFDLLDRTSDNSGKIKYIDRNSLKKLLIHDIATILANKITEIKTPEGIRFIHEKINNEKLELGKKTAEKLNRKLNNHCTLLLEKISEKLTSRSANTDQTKELQELNKVFNQINKWIETIEKTSPNEDSQQKQKLKENMIAIYSTTIQSVEPDPQDLSITKSKLHSIQELSKTIRNHNKSVSSEKQALFEKFEHDTKQCLSRLEKQLNELPNLIDQLNKDEEKIVQLNIRSNKLSNERFKIIIENSNLDTDLEIHRMNIKEKFLGKLRIVRKLHGKYNKQKRPIKERKQEISTRLKTIKIEKKESTIQKKQIISRIWKTRSQILNLLIKYRSSVTSLEDFNRIKVPLVNIAKLMKNLNDTTNKTTTSDYQEIPEPTRQAPKLPLRLLPRRPNH